MDLLQREHPKSLAELGEGQKRQVNYRDVKSSDRPQPRGPKNWPRPHVVRPRGLVYCDVLISYSVANCQFQLNI